VVEYDYKKAALLRSNSNPMQSLPFGEGLIPLQGEKTYLINYQKQKP